VQKELESLLPSDNTPQKTFKFRIIDYNDAEVDAEIQLNAQAFQFSLRPVYLPDFPVLVESRNLDSEIMNRTRPARLLEMGGHKATTNLTGFKF